MALLLGVVLDLVFGEPRRWHPLVGFGRVAMWLEARMNQASQRRIKGVLAWGLLIIPISLLFYLMNTPWWIDALIVYWAIGYRSLRAHVKAILAPLRQQQLPAARQALGRIVSRDTKDMDALAVRRGALESLLENGSDAVFAPVFWFVVAGAPGVVLYRLANTLDAMWGYRTECYRDFGWCSARVDDVLNYFPARLVAIGYAVLGQRQQAFDCWREQAPLCDSPNAGPVMCAGAGALGVTLGGPAVYHGQLKDKPVMGCGSEPQDRDLEKGLVLLGRTLGLWCMVGVVILECL